MFIRSIDFDLLEKLIDKSSEVTPWSHIANSVQDLISGFSWLLLWAILNKIQV